MPDDKINRHIESEAFKKVERLKPKSDVKKAKKEPDVAALTLYGRQFHIAGAAQRKARDPIFV